jgi:uncharacterized membrane protein
MIGRNTYVQKDLYEVLRGRHLLPDLISWINRYYIDPIVYDTGYNPVDTATWAIILGLALLGLISLFRQLELQIDERLILSTIPYIFAGASLRVIEDAELVREPWKYLLITPMIYLLVFAVALSALLLTRWLGGREFYRTYAAIGGLWTLVNLAVLVWMGFANLWVIFAVFFLGTAMAGSIYLLRLIFPTFGFLEDRYNLAVIYVHMLDASSTFLGVDWFGYREEHVIPTYLIDLTGTAAVMFPLKLLILLPALAAIDRYAESPSLRYLLKLTLIVLGLAPAVRNTMRLALGV